MAGLAGKGSTPTCPLEFTTDSVRKSPSQQRRYDAGTVVCAAVCLEWARNYLCLLLAPLLLSLATTAFQFPAGACCVVGLPPQPAVDPTPCTAIRRPRPVQRRRQPDVTGGKTRRRRLRLWLLISHPRSHTKFPQSSIPTALCIKPLLARGAKRGRACLGRGAPTVTVRGLLLNYKLRGCRVWMATLRCWGVMRCHGCRTSPQRLQRANLEGANWS